ncbi:hypothetical protein [Halomonas salinarum]|uniref:hypothetical protein n=1 Tax=Halomonas salinarum TaxID=1158993 RepID=UPI00143AD1BE|nr:hypothetical protein [Halomonas salinarum]
MSSVCLIDTCVFLNLLNVPGKNADKDQVVESYSEYAQLGMTFILPMATIVETGNHIAQNGDGNQRRSVAGRFCEVVEGAFSGAAPYRPSDFPAATEVLRWLHEFPNHAGRNKSQEKTGEGTSFGDLSIIKEFEKCVERFSMSEIFIWSLDSDLRCYHYVP